MTKSFIHDIYSFAKQEGVDIVSFDKGQSKDEVTQRYLAKFSAQEGVLYIGKAQEKFNTFRTSKKFSTDTRYRPAFPLANARHGDV